MLRRINDQAARIRKGLQLGLLACALPLASCKQAAPPDNISAVKAGGGAHNVRPFWLKSPESILGTVTRTFGITVSDAEAQRYFANVHALLGGTSVSQRRATLTEPNDLYVLTLDNLAAWLSKRIVERQQEFDGQGSNQSDAPFSGYAGSIKITDAAACMACYQDAEKEWCDCPDGVTTSYLRDKSLNPSQVAGDTETMKRLMHNVQDLGEFLRCRTGLLDDRTMVGSESRQKHAMRYLIEDVFLPALRSGESSEGQAWARVTHAILMGQGCFLKL